MILMSLWAILLSQATLANLSDTLNSAPNSPLKSEPSKTLNSAFTAAPRLNIASQNSFLDVNDAYQLKTQIDLSNNTLQLHWEIAPGYYLYQHQTKLLLDSDSRPLTFEFPQGLIKYDDYFERELEVYYTQLQLTVELPVNNTQKPYLLQIHSQGCADAGLCYPPQTQFLEINNGNAYLIDNSKPSAAPPKNSSVKLKTLLLSILGAIAGGILLNLMPCVFPVLSLKALSLIQQRDQSHQKKHGWAYTLGAVSTFIIIAAIMFALRSAGQAVGWGCQLQSPIVIASLAYLFFIIGLLLFGQFNLSFSVFTRLNNRGQHLTEGGGLKGSFFTGALAAIVASPCTAPFMAGALGYAITLPVGMGLMIFAALGFVMALPFFRGPLISTLFYSFIFFAGYEVLANRLRKSAHSFSYPVAR